LIIKQFSFIPDKKSGIFDFRAKRACFILSVNIDSSAEGQFPYISVIFDFSAENAPFKKTRDFRLTYEPCRSKKPVIPDQTESQVFC